MGLRWSGVLLLLLLAGCRSGGPRTGITVLIEAAPESLDDRMALSGVAQRIAQLIAPGLVTFDAQSRPAPDLAESFVWEDPTHIRFTLRPGLTFHDGSALTAEDVKATFDGVVQPELKSVKGDKYKAVKKIEVLDERTVRFTLEGPYSPFLAELTLGIVPRERAFMPAARLQDTAPIGAGPFRFVSRPDEDHLELAPFDGYYAGAPEISKLQLRVVRDETTRVLELLKGRADLVVGAVSPAVLPPIRRAEHLKVLAPPGTGYAYMSFNVRGGPLADVRVRRAICHALVLPPIIEFKFHGLAEPATSMLPKTHWAYEKTDGCPHDLKRAGELLDEAGFPDPDGDGPLPRLSLTLKTSTDRFRKSIALVFQEQLSRAGIDLEVRSLEFGTFFSDIRKGNFEIATLKFPAVIEPDLFRYVFASEQIPTAANSWGGLNRTGYSDPEVDRLLRRATEVPGDERIPLYARAQQVLDRELPFVSLWHEASISVTSDRLADYQASPHGFFTPLGRAREVTR